MNLSQKIKRCYSNSIIDPNLNNSMHRISFKWFMWVLITKPFGRPSEKEGNSDRNIFLSLSNWV